ncbi:MAG TPA: DNA-formamidopyrimidine glycosylase family protein [Dehalococcoidia bacterium]|nr:DNA-formamidopyrimidine glycosylase family protein [Dehalococcoidia bacterium]
MPEIPDLESIRAILNRDLAGATIESVEVLKPNVVRMAAGDFAARLTGVAIKTIDRYGKFLLFRLSSGDVLALNAMLVGRLQHVDPSKKRGGRTCWVLGLSNGRELRYVDLRLMGKTYLVKASEVGTIPQFVEMGPDVLDPAFSEDDFLERLRKYRGQVKNVLINAKFVAGIGNAYSDEILFVAGTHPFTKVKDLDEGRRRRLYQAIHEVFDWATPIVAAEMGEATDKKPRDFLRVHRKGGELCPVCGSTISEVSPNKRTTSFCRTCQPGITQI